MRLRDVARAEPRIPGPPPEPSPPPAKAPRSRRLPGFLPERPLRWDNRRSMVFDILVALGVLGYALLPILLFDVPVDYPLGLSGPAFFALSTLTGLAVVARRRWPAGLCVAVILLIPADICVQALPVGLYSLAKYGRSRRTLAVLSVVATLATAAQALFAGQSEPTVVDLVFRLPNVGFHGRAGPGRHVCGGATDGGAEPAGEVRTART